MSEEELIEELSSLFNDVEEELIEELSSLFNDVEDDEERYTDTIFRKITNLQQENKQLKERFERLVQEHIDTTTRNEEKQQRIDKAIEYIKELDTETTDMYEIARYVKKELLEILGDKENE